nr:MAG TPA: hypothetical protein [Caudoviricetes sp.]
MLSLRHIRIFWWRKSTLNPAFVKFTTDIKISG